VINSPTSYTAIQIVPRRTNRHDGIGDYATCLAEAMLERAGINSAFVSGTPRRMEPPRADRWQTDPVLYRTGRGLAKQLSELCRDRDLAAVVIHVSGYGYEKRGAPIWLLRGMRSWRRTHSNLMLFGIFHELFATGRIWNSSFWLSRLQAHITRGIWELCDGGLATTARYFEQLTSWRPHMKSSLCTMPVFSNVGEPNLILPIQNRPLNMVVFGQPGVERRLYTGSGYELAASIVENLQIHKIVDVGARIDAPPDRVGRVPVLSLGQLSPNCVSQQLMSCQFGLLDYDIGRLEKSGVFAAYAAHGVIPICIGAHVKPSHGLQEGRHFLRWPLNKLPDLGAIQRDLIEWYSGHSIRKHADLLSSWCRPENGMQRIQTA